MAEPTIICPNCKTEIRLTESLAKAQAAILLAGDAAMRRLAEAEEVRCHGVLWVFDRLEEHRVVQAGVLHGGLTRVVAHPRCRLPQDAVSQRSKSYSAQAE